MQHTITEYHLTQNTDKETIIFIHGLGTNLSQFEKQHCYFCKTYQVLSITLSLEKNNHSLNTIATEIKTLLVKLHINHVHIVGNSMGGNIGFELLKSYPNIVNSLCIFGTTPTMKTSQFFSLYIKFLIWILPIKFIAKIASISGVSSYSKHKIFEMFMNCSKKSLYRSINILSNFDYMKEIEKKKKPLCIIKAQKDKKINKLLKKPIKKWKKQSWFTLFEIEKAGHFANLDEPVKFNEFLSKFLNTL